MTFRLVVAVVRLFNLVTGHRLVRRGDGRVPAEGGAVVAINHTAYVDFIYAGLEAYRHDRRQLRFMGKVELSRNPILRWAMRGSGVILVDRSAGRDSFVAAVEELRRGEVVGIYPEATISRSFEIKAFKSGAARMALEADVPIIPAIVWGAQRIATKGRPQASRSHQDAGDGGRRRADRRRRHGRGAHRAAAGRDAGDAPRRAGRLRPAPGR